tara:strand:+ start:242 stop:562 length:321 start_codon:yes stop_codon:yes gene_type:complete
MENTIAERPNNYYKFLHSIINNNNESFLEYEYPFAKEQHIIYFNDGIHKYNIQDDIPEQIVDEVVPKKIQKPKSYFYKYLFGSMLLTCTSVTVSYYFYKKKNKNKN